MSPLWVVPVLVLAVGAVALAAASRRLAAAVSGLRPGVDDLRSLGRDAAAVAAELEATRRRGAEIGDVTGRVRALRRAAAEARRSGVDR